jgi:hypothetical protein
MTPEILKERIEEKELILKLSKDYVASLKKQLEDCKDDEGLVDYLSDRIEIGEMEQKYLSENIKLAKSLLAKLEEEERSCGNCLFGIKSEEVSGDIVDRRIAKKNKGMVLCVQYDGECKDRYGSWVEKEHGCRYWMNNPACNGKESEAIR